MLPAPRVPDGLTITPSPFRKQADTEAPADLIPDNGIVERFHKTVLDEFYRVAFRKKIYGSIGELQTISMIGSRTTTRKGRTRDDGASAKRKRRPSTLATNRPSFGHFRDIAAALSRLLNIEMPMWITARRCSIPRGSRSSS